MDNLPELRDIHLPDGVSVFPPAYGWWVILGGVVLAFVLAEIFILVRRKSKKLYALRLLNNTEGRGVVPAAVRMSEILRRICVFKYKEAAALFGRDWIDFLNSRGKSKIGGKAADLLLNAPYVSPASGVYSETDAAELRRFCKDWIGENL